MKIATCVNNHIYDSDIYATCPYCDPVPQGTDSGASVDPPESGAGDKTTLVSPGKIVGWLACISGAATGKSYDLYDRQNRVGRDRSLDVCIEGDPTVSEKHCLVAYDSRHNRFTLVPKTETNRMSLNGKQVEKATELSSFDRIEMGKSGFIFVALCGDRFNWKTAGSGQEGEEPVSDQK